MDIPKVTYSTSLGDTKVSEKVSNSRNTVASFIEYIVPREERTVQFAARLFKKATECGKTTSVLTSLTDNSTSTVVAKIEKVYNRSDGVNLQPFVALGIIRLVSDLPQTAINLQDALVVVCVDAIRRLTAESTEIDIKGLQALSACLLTLSGIVQSFPKYCNEERSKFAESRIRLETVAVDLVSWTQATLDQKKVPADPAKPENFNEYSGVLKRLALMSYCFLEKLHASDIYIDASKQPSIMTVAGSRGFGPFFQCLGKAVHADEGASPLLVSLLKRYCQHLHNHLSMLSPAVLEQVLSTAQTFCLNLNVSGELKLSQEFFKSGHKYGESIGQQNIRLQNSDPSGVESHDAVLLKGHQLAKAMKVFSLKESPTVKVS